MNDLKPYQTRKMPLSKFESPDWTATPESIVIEAFLSAINGEVKYPTWFNKYARFGYLKALGFFEQMGVYNDEKTRGECFEAILIHCYGYDPEEIKRIKES